MYVERGGFERYAAFYCQNKLPTWHGPDFCNFCNFPQNVLRLMSLRFTPKRLLCFDSHFLVNTRRCSSQQLSVISSKYCLCFQLELRPSWTLVRPKKPSFLGLKTRVLPHHSLKIARWVYRFARQGYLESITGSTDR